MKAESDREIDKLNEAPDEYLQRRNTEAVNRLALLSTILGAGAVITAILNFARDLAACSLILAPEILNSRRHPTKNRFRDLRSAAVPVPVRSQLVRLPGQSPTAINEIAVATRDEPEAWPT